MKTYYYYVSFFILALVVNVLLLIRVIGEGMPMIDRWSSPMVEGLDGTTVFTVFRWITELGSGTFLIPFSIVFAIFLWWYARDWLAAVMLPLGTLLGYRVNHWIKISVNRERPSIFEEAEGVGYSFPSGHAMVALIAYGLCIYYLIKYTESKKIALWINIIGISLILLIGMSRYVIHVHYLSDVLAGFGFGIMFLFCWIGLYHLIGNWKVK
ncbi:phosphatase PAP2 family protein [Aquibacillus koreensis]|uniref:Phosphatase PAP2 family protein n=1 Tax=Aquibacillus koreensis TaxID=279446 RepID=A0A9X3WI43_9BACI|nr:phosphatase PAP2 family protein [Aquibacillus koreensis]MCT2535575.1 phosphatase PAP2 family protein [Aquibacillus koreensis]MDC3420140.1 phosphatase PAP2 family protein [Aquibacillus koreensis]